MNDLQAIYERQIRRLEDVDGFVTRVDLRQEFLTLHFSGGLFAMFKVVEGFGGASCCQLAFCNWKPSVPDLVKAGLLEADRALELLCYKNT